MATPKHIKWGTAYLFLITLFLMTAIQIHSHLHYQRESQLKATELAAGPWVHTFPAKRGAPTRKIRLVGESRPYAQVTLYAKVSGYLKEIRVDKGDRVRKEQILAVIESPETDREYQGALADAKNKRSISRRLNSLREKALVSAQEAEQAESEAQISEAKLAGLGVQKSYETLTAPFSGVVTARFADPGALVQNAANSQTSALPVVTISQLERLRIYLYLNQKDAALVKIGDSATLDFKEWPDEPISAQVSRIAGELDPKTRMLLTEIDIDNTLLKILPGGLVEVTLQLRSEGGNSMEIPAEALLYRQGKPHVALVNDQSRLQYQEVRVSSNEGTVLRVLGNLHEGDRLALNLGGSFPEGTQVRLSP